MNSCCILEKKAPKHRGMNIGNASAYFGKTYGTNMYEQTKKIREMAIYKVVIFNVSLLKYGTAFSFGLLSCLYMST